MSTKKTTSANNPSGQPRNLGPSKSQHANRATTSQLEIVSEGPALSQNSRAKSQSQFSEGGVAESNPVGEEIAPPPVPVASVPTPPTPNKAILFHVISGDQVGEEFLVHADCTVPIMMNFIKRRVTEDKTIPEEAVLELFDDNGDSLNLHKSEPVERGTGYVRHRGVYFPMYFIPETEESDDPEDGESSEGSSKKDVSVITEVQGQYPEEIAGESPCDEYYDDNDLAELEVIKHPCGSSSVSNTSVSTEGSGKSRAFRQGSLTQQEEFGEDGPPYQSQRQPHRHHHHHHEFCGEGDQNPGEKVGQLGANQDSQDGKEGPKPNKYRKKDRKSLAVNVQVSPAYEEIYGEERGEQQATTVPPEKPEDISEGTLNLNAGQVPQKQRRSDFKGSVVLTPAEILPLEKSKVAKGEKKRKGKKGSKGKKSMAASLPESAELPQAETKRQSMDRPPRGSTDIPDVPDPKGAEPVEMEAGESQSPPPTTPIEGEPEAQAEPVDETLKYKIEMEGDKKIVYIPIISSSFDESVRVCKWVVDLHHEIDRGVQDVEPDVEPEAPTATPPPPTESQPVVAPTTTTEGKKTKGKGKGKGKEAKEGRKTKKEERERKEAQAAVVDNSDNVPNN